MFQIREHLSQQLRLAFYGAGLLVLASCSSFSKNVNTKSSDADAKPKLWSLKADFEFKGDRVGGLSSVYIDEQNSRAWAVSDDRGRFGRPRIYEFEFREDSSNIEITKVYRVKPEQTKSIRDMEGICRLKNGRFIVSYEGDYRENPKILGGIIEVDLESKNAEADIEVLRSFQLPSHFVAETSGVQTKGIRNNLGFEGLSCRDDSFFAATENGLQHEEDKLQSHLITYRNLSQKGSELNSKGEWLYSLSGLLSGQISMRNGVSSIFAKSDSEVYFLERGLDLKRSKSSFAIQIEKVDTSSANEKPNELVKHTFLAYPDIQKAFGSEDLPNFEGLFITEHYIYLIVDNNFLENSPTYLLRIPWKKQ